jgi:hypothetical protein
MRQRRSRRSRQGHLFDESPSGPQPAVPEETRDELIELLTQWLHNLNESMVREERDA